MSEKSKLLRFQQKVKVVKNAFLKNNVGYVISYKANTNKSDKRSSLMYEVEFQTEFGETVRLWISDTQLERVK